MKERSFKTQGIYFDLELIFKELNERFFAGSINARLRWGIRRQSEGKKSLRLGSYQPKNKIITINPCLDQAVVPRLCLERILFHEMIHQYMPAKKSALGKNSIHHDEFNAFEKNFPFLKEADLWLSANLARLLRS
jgi:hypothetical protein